MFVKCFSLVPVCEASVFIAVSSPHRAAAIAAAEFCINQVKATVPIWKKVKNRNIYKPTIFKMKTDFNLKFESDLVPGLKPSYTTLSRTTCYKHYLS